MLLLQNLKSVLEIELLKLRKKQILREKDQVIGLMMYLGDPTRIKRTFVYVANKSKCLEMKQIAEETSFAYYECA